MVGAVLRIEFGEFPIAALGNRILLARQHSRRSGQTFENRFLFGLPLVDLGQPAQFFDDQTEQCNIGRRCIEIVNVARCFKAEPYSRENPEVLIVRLCDL